MDLEPPVSVGSRCPTTNVFTSTISNCAKASPCRSGWRCSIRGSSSYRSGRSTASRAGAGWSFQPPPEPKKLIDHNAHTQKHQYDDDGGLHLLIIPRGWRGRVLFRPPFAPRPRDGVSSGLDGLFSAHVGDKGWLHPLPLRGETPGGSPDVENTAQPRVRRLSTLLHEEGSGRLSAIGGNGRIGC